MAARRHAEIAGAGLSGLAATALCQRVDEGMRAARRIPTGTRELVMG